MSIHDRGFASMDPDLVSLISHFGGKASQKARTARNPFCDPAFAKAAGRKGGQEAQKRRREAHGRPVPQR